jgi:hypothetical protein
MKRIFFKGRFIFIPIAVAAFLSLISYVVMQLWNYLLPAILHVTAITFWQAMGIFILCKILFGFGRGKGGGWGNRGPWMRHRMEEHLKQMTPEQRERFKQKMSDRMCGYKGRFGRHGFEGDWMNFAEAQENDEAKKPTE